MNMVTSRNIVSSSLEWGGKTLVLEYGRVGSKSPCVVVSYGKTKIVVNVTVGCVNSFGEERAPAYNDGISLMVNMTYRAYAISRIPGGYSKREGKPSDADTLMSRFIDRSIRPIINPSFVQDICVSCLIVSHETGGGVPIEVAGVIGASAALGIAGVPMREHVAAAHVSLMGPDNNLSLNCKSTETSPALDLLVSSCSTSAIAVESECQEVEESVVLNAISYAAESMSPVLPYIKNFVDECRPASDGVVNSEDLLAPLRKKVKEDFNSAFASIYSKDDDKESKHKALIVLRKSILEGLIESYDSASIKQVVNKIEKEVVRSAILDGRRLDNRGNREIRRVDVETNLLPSSHGSALFTRGDTQSMVSVILGTNQDTQSVDDINGDKKECFFLHYNFPPYCVGEVGAPRAPSRREIGHGILATKSIRPVLPNKKDFPYVIRAVSEITSSDGSSSMATVCGTSLALCDAGVSIKSPVAGVAMGLVKDNDRHVILTDILGTEDSIGDMDLKVAGTKNGITSLQMDVKLEFNASAISEKVMEEALEDARVARLSILKDMKQAMDDAGDSDKADSPCILHCKIDASKVSKLIGSRGKNIRKLCEVSEAKIDVEDESESGDVLVTISAASKERANQAKSLIDKCIAEPSVGVVYDGVVVRVETFGIFVQFLGDNQGLVHVSEITGERIEIVADLFKGNEAVKVVVLGFEKGNKIRLSMRSVDQVTGGLLSSDNINRSRPSTSRPPRPSSGGPGGYRSGSRSSSDYGSYGSRSSSDYGSRSSFSDYDNRGGGSGRRPSNGGAHKPTRKRFM